MNKAREGSRRQKRGTRKRNYERKGRWTKGEKTIESRRKETNDNKTGRRDRRKEEKKSRKGTK